MNVWEIIILMVMATVCISCGIGVVYNSIVNTVERYQIRKTKRELEIYTKVMEAIPTVFKTIIDMVSEEEKKQQLEFNERMKKYDKEIEELTK